MTQKGVHKPEFKDNMDRYTLDKFFSLVWFLDQAKAKKVMESDQCLFDKVRSNQ